MSIIVTCHLRIGGESDAVKRWYRPMGLGPRTGRGLGECKKTSLLDVIVRIGTIVGLVCGLYRLIREDKGGVGNRR